MNQSSNSEKREPPHARWQHLSIFLMLVLLVSVASAVSCRPKPRDSKLTPGVDAKANDANIGKTSIELSKIQRLDTSTNQIADRIDTKNDDWDSEKQSDKAIQQLNSLAELVENKQLDDSHLAKILSADFQCRFGDILTDETAFDDQTFLIHRASGDTAKSMRGFDGFRNLVANWKRQPPTESALKLKFKLFQIKPNQNGFTTRAYLDISRSDHTLSAQQNLEVQCVWKANNFEAKLLNFSVLNSTRAQVNAPNGKLLVDCTRTLMDSQQAYRQQVVPGIPHWTRRIGRELMGQFGHHGLAIADVNGDGLEDIYACDTGGLPNRLYLQRLDGTIKDVSKESGVDLLEESLGALFVDLDNDGDQDLVVVSDPSVHFAENDGAGRFKLRTPVMIETDGYSLTAADFDQDNDLDIYVCGYNARRQDAVNRGLPFPLPYHDANNGGQNYLLRNEGDFQFVDATNEVGLDADNRRFSLAAAWEDYDNDGDQDLYVANDFGRNCLYQNQSGKFVNVAAAAGVEDQASGMSVSWGDYDNDGLVDLYVSNMFSAAGNRVTFQRRFAGSISDATVSHVQRMARGNTLFRNQGDGTFEDTSVSAKVTQGRWAWGSRFVDLNNDGWQDIVVANGYITNEDTSDL